MIELAQNPSKVTDEFRIKVMQRLGLFPTGKTMLQDMNDRVFLAFLRMAIDARNDSNNFYRLKDAFNEVKL